MDGLRVDAVASMLYRDYSREQGQWAASISMAGAKNPWNRSHSSSASTTIVRERAPGAVTIAEESTAFPGCRIPVAEGGLGFDYKWNMAWMHDTLQYAARERFIAPNHHNELTFGLVYAFSEHFVLPISHDEVVHARVH